MRVLIHAWGSRGDVQPSLALALALGARGHEAAVAASTDFGEWVGSRGVAFEPIDVSLAELSATEVGRAWLGGTASSARAERRLMRDFLALAAEPIGAMVARTTGAYDVVVTSPVLFEAMLSIPEARGRLAVAMLQPTLATSHGESYVYAVRPGTSVLNALAANASSLAYRPVVAPLRDAACAAAGARAIGLGAFAREVKRVPFLVASSPVVTPPAPDWPAPATVTGFWRLPTPDPWAPSEELTAFLDTGAPPVYVGFGSMSGARAAENAQVMAEAVRRAGVRAVVPRGLLGHEAVGGEVCAIDPAPHELLFPMMAAVVHHGGAGTTAAALHAGVPQVVVPHMGDQPYWGRRMHELGTGARPIPRKELTADGLAAAIREALAPSLAAGARRLADAVRAEDGASRAADLLEGSFNV